MARIAWVDAPAGISGDMFLGALVDAGLPLAVLQQVVVDLGLQDVEVRARQVMRGALAATKVDVCRAGKPIEGQADTHLQLSGDEERTGRHPPGHHRTLADILHLLSPLGSLEQAPLSQAVQVFRHLAEAEARVHGTTAEQVHFHEVGAADALVDIVGTCVGLQYLGIEVVHVSPLPWGQGSVETAHGTMPIPAPATARLLMGWPTVPSPESYEQVTPTGAALVRTLAVGSTTPPGFVPEQIGLGAGTFEGGRLPNILRIVLGHAPPLGGSAWQPLEDEVVLLETNLDDVTGQVAARALERVLEAGALDAWWTPIHMKKGRPALKLSVLARPADGAALEAVLLAETPTLGIRRQRVERVTVPRKIESVETPWGAVSLKVRSGPAGEAATPEYEDCLAIAKAQGMPVQEVIQAVLLAWCQGREGL